MSYIVFPTSHSPQYFHVCMHRITHTRTQSMIMIVAHFVSEREKEKSSADEHPPGNKSVLIKKHIASMRKHFQVARQIEY